MNLVPMVIERTSAGERSFDVISRVLQDRIIFMTGPVDDHMYELISAQIFILDREEGDISVYIHSPGGSVYAGYGIYNVMKTAKNDIRTYVSGQAASMGSFLAACGGTPGKRYMLPETTHMIHQPLGGYQGQATDIMIHAKNIEAMRERLERIYAESTGRSYEEIHAACDRDNYMTAEQSIKFGLADEILSPRNG